MRYKHYLVDKEKKDLHRGPYMRIEGLRRPIRPKQDQSACIKGILSSQFPDRGFLRKILKEESSPWYEKKI